MPFFPLLFALVLSFGSFAATSEEAFRQLFLESLTEDGLARPVERFSQLQFRVPSVLTPSRFESLDEADQALRPLAARELYEAGLKAVPVAGSNLAEGLQKNPSLIVVVPGVFGEFIETHAFDPIFKNQNSSLTRAWGQALAAAPQTDASYSLQDLADRKVPLGELVRMASLDNEKGEPVVRALIFHTPILSLESVGKIENVAAIFSRRLAQALEVLRAAKVPLPESLTFVGYSRGTMVGLEMLAQAKAANASWVGRVKRFVSLGGVVHGTVLADDAFRAGSLSSRQRELVKNHADSLLAASDFRSFVANTHAWNKLALEMARLDPSVLKLLKGDSKIWSVDASNGLRGLLRIWQELGIQKEALAILKGGVPDIRSFPQMFQNLGQAGRQNYVRDIQKWKKSVSEVLAAVGEMTTSARAAWWQSHQVPEIPYYSVVATMTNREDDAKLATSPFGFAMGSFDDEFLMESYRGFQKASGEPAFRLNDSQVAMSHAVFHPRVIEKANGQRLETSVLGVFGTHHWGLALEVVTAMQDGSKNPFPRLSLLRALSALE